MINRALAANGGAATSYLNHSELPADNAIDGKIEGGFNEAWISDPDKNAWWQVDLGPKPAPIKRIIVYFRSDYKTADQTNHISLLASNDPNFEDFKILAQREDENYPAGGAWLINTNHETPYRYLKIAKNQNSYTSLVEVQIWCAG